jgi:hypothetical protein
MSIFSDITPAFPVPNPTCAQFCSDLQFQTHPMSPFLAPPTDRTAPEPAVGRLRGLKIIKILYELRLLGQLLYINPRWTAGWTACHYPRGQPQRRFPPSPLTPPECTPRSLSATLSRNLVGFSSSLDLCHRSRPNSAPRTAKCRP